MTDQTRRRLALPCLAFIITCALLGLDAHLAYADAPSTTVAAETEVVSSQDDKTAVAPSQAETTDSASTPTDGAAETTQPAEAATPASEQTGTDATVTSGEESSSSAITVDGTTDKSVSGDGHSADAETDSQTSAPAASVDAPVSSEETSADPSTDTPSSTVATGEVVESAQGVAASSTPAAPATVGWVGEGTEWRYSDGGTWHQGWLVDATLQDYGLQRYWLDSDGVLRTSSLLDPDTDGSGWWAYARSEGYVVRGKYVSSDGRVYLADNDGRLEDPGWVVTNDYGDGTQRYYVDAATHSAVEGYSADGWDHYTLPSGYVLRGADSSDGTTRYADNDGRLAEHGWLVTSGLGQGLQRYWVGDEGVVASSRLIDPAVDGSGWWAYATPSGYVARGTYVSTDGAVYLADNNGQLENPGWLVTARYDDSLQRYYIDETTRACRTGFFSVDGSGYYGMPEVGYVLRGTRGSAVVADNDGKLVTSAGWLVTDGFGQGLQRYWVEAGGAVATSRLIDPDADGSGWWAYATSAGYVARGKYVSSDSKVYLADNDGRLEDPGWVVSSAYGDGLQRYRVDEGTHACTSGFFAVGDDEYYAIPSQGYVLRGSRDIGVITYYADNDGVLLTPVQGTIPTAKDGVSTSTTSTPVNAISYLFLPSYASLSSVSLSTLRLGGSSAGLLLAAYESGSFSTVATGATVDLTAFSRTTDENGALLFRYMLGEGSMVHTLAVMVSGKIRTVFVISVDPENAGRAYVEASTHHTTKADVSIVVVDPDGTVVYNKDSVSAGKTSTIKGRGNSTWGIGNKKPYQISLSKKTDLLETGNSDNAAKKWLLLANADDATLIHNSIAYDLALELGMCGTESAPVDLYYDGAYRGNYLLCEKIEVGSGRVDIHDLEGDIEDANGDDDVSAHETAQATNAYGYTFQYVSDVANPADITGGYLLELDTAYHSLELCWFDTSVGYFVVKSPEACSVECVRYISEATQAAIDNLDAGVTSSDGYLFDLDSLSWTYLISEYCKNVDAFCSSTYFYLERGSSTFYAEPIWDFDGSCGIRTDFKVAGSYSYAGLLSASDGWVIDIPTVRENVISHCAEFSSLVENVLLGDASAVGAKGFLHSFQYYYDQVATSQKMNQVLFGITGFNNVLTPFSTYAANVEYLRSWLTDRIAWWGWEASRLSAGIVENAPVAYEDVDYSEVYDYSYYLEMNPDVAAAFGDDEEAALRHFVTYGMPEGRVASRNFSVSTYRARYADLRAAFGDDLAAYYRHFITYGFFEGRTAV